MVRAKEHRGNGEAANLQNVLNPHAEYCWKFYRIDTIGVSFKHSCFDTLMGKKDVLSHYYVIMALLPAASKLQDASADAGIQMAVKTSCERWHDGDNTPHL